MQTHADLKHFLQTNQKPLRAFFFFFLVGEEVEREGGGEREIQNSLNLLEQILVATTYPPLFFLDL